MGTIVNAIRTVFSAQGANGVSDATDRVGRAQNRLGQASASAGRSFAAQSQGLGGLVAAYAGAAATIFAITEAFNMLNKAAQAETIVRGTNTLAAEIGQSGPRILKSIQQITQGQLTLAESAQNVNIALAAGFNTSQIEDLTTIATKASRALGRDLTESIQRVTRGAAKLEPELLDELGIFTRIDPAVRAYANSLNVSEASLTNFERRQAFVNAVIEEGNKKFSAINTAAPSAQKSLEQLRAQVATLATEFLQFIGEIAGPFVDFFKNNAGNTLLLFGGILALVLGKGISLFKEWASSSLTSLSTFANKLAQVSEIIKGNLQGIQSAATAANAAIVSRGGLAGSLSGLAASGQSATLAGTGNFVTQLRGQGSRALAQEAAAARQRFLAGGAAVGAQRTADVATFNKVIQNLTASGKTNTLAFRDAQAAVAAYGAASANASITTRVLTGASTALGAAARFAAAGFAILNSFLGVLTLLITAAQLLGMIFGVDLLSKFREYVSKSSQSLENFKAGFTGLIAAANGGANAISQVFKALGADDKYLENLDERLAKVDKRIEARALGLAQAAEVSGMMFVSGPEAAGLAAVMTANTQVTTADKLAQAKRELVKLDEDIAEASGNNRGALLIERQELQTLIAQYETGTDVLAGFVGQVARYTGIDTETIAKLATAQGLVIQKTGDGVTILGKFVNTLVNGDEKLQKFIGSGFSLQNTLNLANDEFNRGATDSERLSQKLAGAKNAFDELQTSGFATTAELQKAAAALEDLSNKVRDLKILESILDGIRKAFSSSIAAVESAPFSGFISATGQIAKNANEAEANQRAYLGAVIEATSNAVRLSQTGANLNADELKQVELNATARKALTGQLLQNLETVQKLKATEEERTRQLAQQKVLLAAQNGLAQAQALITAAATSRNIRLDFRQRNLDISKAQIDFDRKSFDISQDSLKLSNDLLNVESQIAIAKSSGTSSAASDKARLDAARAELKLLQAERQITMVERDPASSQQDLVDARRNVILLQQQIAKEEYENKLAVIRAQGGANKAQQEFDIAKINQEIVLLQNEQKFADDNIAKQLKLFDDETRLNEAKIRAQKQALGDQKAILALQKDLDLLRISQDRANTDAKNAILIAELQGYKTFANSITSLLGGFDAFARTVAEILGFAGADTAAITAVIRDLPKQVIADIDGVIAAANANIATQNGLYSDQEKNVQAIYDINNRSLNDQIRGNEQQLSQYQELRGVQRQALEADLKAARDSLATKIAILEKEKELVRVQGAAGGVNIEAQLAQAKAEYAVVTEQLTYAMQDLNFETDTFRQALLGIKDAFRDTLTQELMNLNKSLFEAGDSTKSFGERLKDSIGNVLRSVQETFFRKTIAEPLSNFVTDSLFGMFGLGGARGIDSAKVDADGSLRVRVVNPAIPGMAGTETDPNNPIGSTINNLTSGIQGFFNKIFGEGGMLRNIFNGIFGQGGILGNLLSGVFGQNGIFSQLLQGLFGGATGGGGFFSSILSFVGSIFTGTPMVAAQGGMVHMAQGGLLSAGSQLRDRVPSLLEPGEFVVRKPAARQIGVPALQAMNATGQVPNAGNVTVNITNKGTPQDAQASQPRFDGEKYVIDIVTRDLANNGPIRRTLRGK